MALSFLRSIEHIRILGIELDLQTWTIVLRQFTKTNALEQWYFVFE